MYFNSFMENIDNINQYIVIPEHKERTKWSEV